jgi:glycerophosphoryl diester phosphodiesterase
MSALLRIAGVALLVAAVACPAAGAAVDVHAHRGGTLVNGNPVTPENSLTAFKVARGRGADVVELDVHVTSDGVPIVMHDPDLDRTTDCTGFVPEVTAAYIAGCHIDILGTNDPFTQAPGATEPVPRLADVLAWAKTSGARLNIELNNYLNERGYDPTSRFVDVSLAAIEGSGVPKSRILIQSFIQTNLTAPKQHGFKTAIITFAFANSSAVQAAKDGGYDVVEPQWPIDDAKAFVKDAHAAGKRVIPFTIDKPADALAARRAGVDGLITDDPPAVSAALDCADAKDAVAAAQKRLKAAKSKLARARGAAAKRTAAKRVKKAGRRLAAAKRARARECAT